MAGYDALDVAKKGGETMNKAFAVSVVVMFVVSMVLGFVVHAVLLHQQYAVLTPQLFRGENDAMAHFPYMLAAHVFIAIGFTWVYRQGRENKPFLGQGVRFGLAVAGLPTIPPYPIYFAVQPLPTGLAPPAIVVDPIPLVIMGIPVAAVKPAPVPAP